MTMISLLLACVEAAPDDTAAVEDTVDTAAEALAADDAAVRALDGTPLPTGANPCAAPMLVRVNYAVDGDTFYATPDGGGAARIKVRMIGVDTPEIEHDDPAECYGDEAFAYTRAQLDGHLAWLSFDAECLDRYDRTLAYVTRGAGADGFYNRRLVQLGYATHLEVPPNDAYADMILADERAARTSGVGLWGACAR